MEGWTTSSVQARENNKGSEWVEEKHTAKRRNFIKMLKTVMDAFHEHNERVRWSKSQTNLLLENFQKDTIIVKVDFSENIAHSRGAEPSCAFYNKRQTQFLIFTV